MKTYQNLLRGEWRDSHSGRTMEVVNPTTEEVLAQVPQSDEEDVDAAVASAKEAFPAWQAKSVAERIAYLEKILDQVEASEDRLVETIVTEMGAGVKYTRENQVQRSLKEARAVLAVARDFPFEEEEDGTLIVKEAYGVVACITPWNYPLNQIQRKIIPALVAGNTVVVKPASDTPLTAVVLAEIFAASDLPAGVFNLIMGSGSEAGQKLAEHADVAVISFTGSTTVGQGLYAAASPQIKKLILELGGKSVLLALPGADQEQAVEKSFLTLLNNQGQTCSALSRLLIPAAEKDAYEAALKEFYAEKVVLGDPHEEETLVGPMVSAKQKETVLNYIEKGKAEGAKVLIGDESVAGPGYFVQPTIFTEVTNDMTIAQEEIFGPVLVVITYEDLAEAIDIANDSPYGLSGAVVGPDQDEAVRVARKLRTGNVIVNDGQVAPKAPFGGYKQSGLGREKGRFGLEDYLEVKAIFH